MEFNNDWYDRYTSDAYANGSRKKTGSGNGVRVSTLIICMIVTALIGATVGGLFAKSYVDRSLKKAGDAVRQELSASAPAPSAGLNESAVPIIPPQSAPLASGYSKTQIIELCAPAVVGIETFYDVSKGNYSWYYGYRQEPSNEPIQMGAGSGIILTADGYLITCKHVVDGADKVKVILSDDTEYDAEVIGTDSRNDLAVLKVDATGLTPASLGDSDMLTVGEDVIAIGNPLGELRGTATGGMVSALDREVEMENNITMHLVQTDAAISPGNSGGGLFNASGSLIGIVNAKLSSTNSEGLGFAIPVNSVKTVISDIMDKGYVTGRAYLGVYTQDVTLPSGNNGWGSSSFFGGFFGSMGTNCVQVSDIVKDSAAEKAGLRTGDLIMKLDDTDITSNAVLSGVIATYNAGDTATLHIRRAGEEMDIEVTFGEYRPAE